MGAHRGRENPSNRLQLRWSFHSCTHSCLSDTILSAGSAPRNVTVEEHYVFRWQNNSISGLDITIIRAEISAHQRGNVDKGSRMLSVSPFPVVFRSITPRMRSELVHPVRFSLSQGVRTLLYIRCNFMPGMVLTPVIPALPRLRQEDW